MEIDTKQLRLAALAYDGQDATGQSLAKTLICIADYIDRLKAELEEERSSWSLKAIEQFNRADDLERQLDASRALLAEARAELSFWLALDKDLATGDSVKDKIRQEAAREILRIISIETIDRQFEQSQAAEIIRQRFGLEG